jgi:hypothetical protein
MKGTIVWVGDRGTSKSPHTGKSIVNDVTDKAALVTLRTALAAYVDCNAGRASVVDFDSGTGSAPGVDANVDERAIIYMKDPSDDSVKSITLPAWDVVTYPLDASSEGDRIAAADVAAITALINTATGNSYVGLWGKHIKRT